MGWVVCGRHSSGLRHLKARAGGGYISQPRQRATFNGRERKLLSKLRLDIFQFIAKRLFNKGNHLVFCDANKWHKIFWICWRKLYGLAVIRDTAIADQSQPAVN